MDRTNMVHPLSPHKDTNKEKQIMNKQKQNIPQTIATPRASLALRVNAPTDGS